MSCGSLPSDCSSDISVPADRDFVTAQRDLTQKLYDAFPDTTVDVASLIRRNCSLYTLISELYNVDPLEQSQCSARQEGDTSNEELERVTRDNSRLLDTVERLRSQLELQNVVSADSGVRVSIPSDPHDEIEALDIGQAGRCIDLSEPMEGISCVADSGLYSAQTQSASDVLRQVEQDCDVVDDRLSRLELQVSDLAQSGSPLAYHDTESGVFVSPLLNRIRRLYR